MIVMADQDPIFGLANGAAIVTGAGGGIGREIALGLASRGVPVACLDRSLASVEPVVSEMGEFGGEGLALAADVASEASLEAAVHKAEARLGPLAYAVNAAGINLAGQALDLPIDNWQAVLDVNATGVFLSCRVQARAMLRHGQGSIVNIASMSASIVNRGQDQSAYYASKAAVKHLTRSLAAEWATRGIRVNCISPGYTVTPMLRASQETLDGFSFMTPMARLAKAAEMVGPTLFLLGPASSFVTGHDLKVDGGYTVW